MRIAIFSYRVLAIDPVGGSQRRMLAALCEEHDFVVFAREFDNPRPDRIKHVPVVCPKRPLALQFLVFRAMARLALLRERARSAVQFAFVQAVESSIALPDLVNCHFCHGAYLRAAPLQGTGGVQALLRRIDHHLRAATEPGVYRRCAHVVVPSHGLKREVEAEFPRLAGRVTVIGNPIDVAAWTPPAEFDRVGLRRGRGIADDDFVLVFVALGHFERKGLPLILDAIALLGDARVKLIVVGGHPGIIRPYRVKARRTGIEEQIVFAGTQADPRPFLWAADAFILPSAYETFSKVAYEAAAARLPLIVSRIHGVDDIAVDGDTGFVIERTAAAIAAAVRRLAAESPDMRKIMGQHAARAVAGFTPEAYVESWRSFYRSFARNAPSGQARGGALNHASEAAV